MGVVDFIVLIIVDTVAYTIAEECKPERKTLKDMIVRWLAYTTLWTFFLLFSDKIYESVIFFLITFFFNCSTEYFSKSLKRTSIETSLWIINYVQVFFTFSYLFK